MKEISTSIRLQLIAGCSWLSGAGKLLPAAVRKILLAVILLMLLIAPFNPGPAKAATAPVTILVDDFKPQPFQGSTDTAYYYNRLNGDRGALNNSIVDLLNKQLKVTVNSTCPPNPTCTWGGFFESLNHPDREKLPINFSAILPPQILSVYQSQITGITVEIADGTAGKELRLELKDENNQIQWNNKTNIILAGGPQPPIMIPLPSLTNIHSLNLVLQNAVPGDFVTIKRISFTATTQITDPATKAFVWSYAMLLSNWNSTTGLVRDTAKVASGEMDAIQSTGSLAAATALAEQLGIISKADATGIVNKIGDTLLNKVPRYHGLWPHWVTVSTTGQIAIVGPDGSNDMTGLPCQPGACTDHNGDYLNDLTNAPCDPSRCTDKGTEWSSVDTVISAIGLLDAQNALGLDTAKTEQFLRNIEWNRLQISKGISHGYDFIGKLIPFAWDTFGGESWLAELAYAASTDHVSYSAYPFPPTANGSGFIDELAWLLVLPPSAGDYWGNDWDTYRASASNTQITYHSINYPTSCLSQLGLFGLSAAEVPDPSLVTEGNIYQAFGVGGQFAPPNDGLKKDGKPNGGPTGAPVSVPHYSAMIASLHSTEAINMWSWLINREYFSPLNNVESLMYSPMSDCSSTTIRLNDLKGSWNLALQTLGWGKYLAQKKGLLPVTWLATSQNSFLHNGYLLLTKICMTCAKVNTLVGRNVVGRYFLNTFQSTRDSYSNVNNGPVNLMSTNEIPLIASQRVIFNNLSHSEMMGLPVEQVSQEYWFPSYNNLNLNSQLRVGNLGNVPTTISVYLGNTRIDQYTLAAGAATRKNYNYNSGPLRVTSSATKILTTIRLLYNNQSFSELMGLPKEQLTTSYLFPWYNNVAMTSNLQVSNVGTVPTTIKVYLGTTQIDSFSLPAKSTTSKIYDGKNEGPLKVTSSAANIVPSIRVLFAGQSYSEMIGYPANKLTTEYWYPVYDNATLNSQLRVSNVGTGPTTIKVYVGNNPNPIASYSLAAGKATRYNYSYNTGPLHVVSSSQPILSTVRELYQTPTFQSLYELMGMPKTQLSTQYYVPWYNNVAMNSELRLAVP